MKYTSTRNVFERISGIDTIIKGISDNGGLYVPTNFPYFDIHDLHGDYSYNEIAFIILKEFFNEIEEKNLKDILDNSYNKNNFSSKNIINLKVLNDKLNVCELYYGPTAAFKDYALQLMPKLFKEALRIKNFDKKILILTATSGDTGKAALEGYKNIDGIEIIVFYPKDGVSKIQELQMITTDGSNTHVIGLEGNFDDCQNLVKKIFNDKDFKKTLLNKNYVLSSANSINFGRLIPQVVYYFYSYLKSIDDKTLFIGDKVNFCVPSGNFGNILAGYYAKMMGLPINKLICASNINNVLTDFINSGFYNKNREFFKTYSPSMDILISSNLERLLFHLYNNNSFKIKKFYSELNKKGYFKIDKKQLIKLQELFYADYSNEDETLKTIEKTFNEYRYLIDPHTAVGLNVYQKYQQKTGDNTKTILLSTASPYKFNNAVYKALFKDENEKDEFTMANKILNLTKQDMPASLNNLQNLEIKHKTTIKKEEAYDTILRILSK